MNLFSFACSHEGFVLVCLQGEQTLSGGKGGTGGDGSCISVQIRFQKSRSATCVVILASILSDMGPFITVFLACLWNVPCCLA